MQQSPDEVRDSIARRRSLWSKPSSRWLLGIPLGGFLMLLLGIALANGFAFAMHATSTPEFCGYACHYMRDFVTTELPNTPHGRNPAGVAATCPDCHVPQPFFAKMKRKIEATREGWGHLRGVINTRDKFEAHKLEMAERVWAQMKATDSRECRTCHDYKTMDFEAQDKSAARKHKAAIEKGETCIDCHKGVAHSLPAGYEEGMESADVE
jgi:nitrate/TMAO reductase-like tetraheme cytochrome c subunit